MVGAVEEQGTEKVRRLRWTCVIPGPVWCTCSCVSLCENCCRPAARVSPSAGCRDGLPLTRMGQRIQPYSVMV